jgi:hypothetical protein
MRTYIDLIRMNTYMKSSSLLMKSLMLSLSPFFNKFESLNSFFESLSVIIFFFSDIYHMLKSKSWIHTIYQIIKTLKKSNII